MKKAIFTYLRSKKLTDIKLVNRLFVSSFLRHYYLMPQVNTLLIDNYIKAGSEEESLLEELMCKLDENDCTYTLEDLTKLFEFVISPEDRKVTGAIYTPDYIRERIITEIFDDYNEDLDNIHIADISCGCGGFFLTSAMYIHSRTGKSFNDIISENIFGTDIQDYSIERTKLLLSIMALMAGEDENLEFNLWKGDSLCFDFTIMGRIDVVVGNPPYVCARNMTNESRELLKNWSVCACGNSDLYIPFFQIAIELVRDGGYVGFITMNSFLTSLNGRALREYLHERYYNISIVDFRGTQIFKGKNTYTCLFFLRKEASEHVSYCINESKEFVNEFVFSHVPYEDLDDKEGWKLNNYKETHDKETVGIQLGKFCQSRHGIATLNNNIYIFAPSEETKETFIFEKEGSKFEVEKGICRRIVNSNKLNANVVLDDIKECAIFPYIENMHGSMEIIPEKEMKSKYPKTYGYLQCFRSKLDERDKGKTDKYPSWYAYGRTQSLKMPRYKLFFPKIANKPLNCEIVDDKDLLLYNGMAFVSDDESLMLLLKKILESDVFWKYVTLNGKPYASGYYSLNGVNIKHFGIPLFNKEEKDILLKLKNKEDINDWLRNFYMIKN